MHGAALLCQADMCVHIGPQHLGHVVQLGSVLLQACTVEPLQSAATEAVLQRCVFQSTQVRILGHPQRGPFSDCHWLRLLLASTPWSGCRA